MPAGAPFATVVRFGVFELDLDAGELRRGGVRLRLQKQPFEILKVLVQRTGKVVTREELRSIIWSADTFVDFDNSLNTAVNKLRDILGDTSSNPVFIETIPRRGYRFIAPVSHNGQEAITVAPALPNRIRWRSLAATAALVLAFGAGAWLYVRRTRSPAEKYTIMVDGFVN